MLIQYDIHSLKSERKVHVSELPRDSFDVSNSLMDYRYI